VVLRLEDQRVQPRAAEARAALEARRDALEERERAARAAQDQAERQREAQARQEQLRQEQVRHEALQRVRFELEAAERAEREQRAIDHAIALERLRQPSQRARLVTWLNVVLAAGLVGCAALYFGALRPALESTRTLAAQAQALAVQRAQALDELRNALRQAAPVPTGVQPVTLPPAAKPVGKASPERDRSRPRIQVRPTPSAEDGNGLGDLDVDSDDPFDLGEHPSPRRQTRRR